VALAGFCAFLDLYATQSLLPLLAREFAAGPGEVSLTVSAIIIAIALIAPFTGAVADVLGRKRVITAAMFALILPTLLIAAAGGLSPSSSGASCKGCCCRPSSPSWLHVSARNGRRRRRRQ